MRPELAKTKHIGGTYHKIWLDGLKLDDGNDTREPKFIPLDLPEATVVPPSDEYQRLVDATKAEAKERFWKDQVPVEENESNLYAIAPKGQLDARYTAD